MYSHGGTSVGRQTKDTNMLLAPNDDFCTKVFPEGLNLHNMRMTQKVIFWGEFLYGSTTNRFSGTSYIGPVQIPKFDLMKPWATWNEVCYEQSYFLPGSPGAMKTRRRRCSLLCSSPVRLSAYLF